MMVSPVGVGWLSQLLFPFHCAIEPCSPPTQYELVFAHPHTGKPIDRSRLLKRFKAALARGEVRPMRFHDLRHTFGTRMAAQGVPMRALQEMMGHRDFKTTLIYADYAPSPHEAEWIEAAFRSPASELAAELPAAEPVSVGE